MGARHIRGLERAIALRERGATLAAIGRLVGLSARALSWHFLAAGVERPKPAPLRDARQVGIVEERGADFIVHRWFGDAWPNGAGVMPPSSYPTLRKAAARLLQLLGTGAVAPQTWPEAVCIGTVSTEHE